MKGFSNWLAAVMLMAACSAQGQSTNNPSDPEIQGRALAQKISEQLEQQPAEDLTNTGVLRIKDDKGHSTSVPLVFKIQVTPNGWQTSYEATTPAGNEKLTINRGPNHLRELSYEPAGATTNSADVPLPDHPFAHSDFAIGDLDLQFFGWPGQKVLRREVHRSCGCTVLESTNPEPGPNGYSRVVSWIDNDSLGIVEAEAYDIRGKLLKDFEPKDLKKVNGQYQVQTMVMENVQTGTRTRMEFDLKK